MLETDAHGIKYARDTFMEYGIDVSGAEDAAVVKAYNSTLLAAATTGRSTDRLFRAVRELNDFVDQPRLDPKWNLNLNELIR